MGVPQRHSGIRRPGRGLKGVQSVGVGGEGGVLGFNLGAFAVRSAGSKKEAPFDKIWGFKSGGEVPYAQKILLRGPGRASGTVP